ncbi:MAG: GntR family transcriptional regulator [Eubacteriaceae bacterium]|jgi:DNA-binding GntR family transcriptional regulator
MSKKQIAYDSIKEKILNCEYKPNSFLNEDLLCEDFGVSRTPVRDALGRLEQEHLVTILPKKGFLVAPLTVNEINMVFEGRLLLEPYILTNYCKNLSSEDLNHMNSIISLYKKAIQDQKNDVYNYDIEFHKCIVNQCTNRYLLRTYNDIENQDRRIRILSGDSNEERLFETVNEHKQILDCLRKNDVTNASLLLISHLQQSKESAFQFYMNGQGSF